MRLLIGLLLSLVACTARAEFPPASWTTPRAPFQLAQDLYYVGTSELAAYLLTSPEGHILIDAPMHENVPHILGAIRALGFDPADVRILLATHAHMDHVGGMAAMREATGARIFISAADAELARRGGAGDFAFGDRMRYPAFEPDVIVGDGDIVELGPHSVRALLTPGHTRGATTWTWSLEEGEGLIDVVLIPSFTAPGYQLIDNAAYPAVLQELYASLDRVAGLRADLFLAPHASFMDIPEAPRPGDLIDPDALPRHLDALRATLERQLAAQRTELEPPG